MVGLIWTLLGMILQATMPIRRLWHDAFGHPMGREESLFHIGSVFTCTCGLVSYQDGHLRSIRFWRPR